MLGIGKKRFLVPVEEVKRDVNEERITVEHPKEKVVESPEFDPDNGLKRTFNAPSTPTTVIRSGRKLTNSKRRSRAV
jgi:hypothetical protein